MRDATQQVRAGVLRSSFAEMSEGLFLTSGYVYDSPEQAEASFLGEVDHFIYSRYSNPTVQMFEGRLAAMEGARFCRATASGMSALWNTLLGLVEQGDRVVAARSLFGSSQVLLNDVLPRYGVRATYVDGRDTDAWREALREPAACVLLETPSNPSLHIIDLPAVCEMAHAAGARVVVDNVFATPILQKPMEAGADVVVYSATKHIDGQGRTLGGAILSDDEAWVTGRLQELLRHTGPALSPFNAWVLLKGLETLELRVMRSCENALSVAMALDGHPGLARVAHPGLSSHPQHALAMRQMRAGGTVLTFDVRGGKDAAFSMMRGLKMIDISNNLGDSRSMVTHPQTTTHRRLTDEARAAQGIGPGTVRLSVGLEDPADITEDVLQALA